jgi:hypothetical protein
MDISLFESISLPMFKPLLLALAYAALAVISRRAAS